MPEAGNSNIEVAHHLSEHKAALPSAAHWTLETLEAIVLAIVAISTAWSGYQAALWTGLQAEKYSLASRLRVQAEGSTITANQECLYNASTVAEWLKAEAQGQKPLADLFERRLLPEFRPAFEAWKNTDPLNNPNAPPSPQLMVEFHSSKTEEATKLNERATETFEQGNVARNHSDEYVRVTVTLATGVGGAFRLNHVDGEGHVIQNPHHQSNARSSHETEVTTMFQRSSLTNLRFAIPLILSSVSLTQLARAQAPMFMVTQEDSSINFSVKASVSIAGKFDKWDATLTFTSPDVTTGVLDIKAQAASVDTGSGFKDDKLKSKDFFNADHDPYITFHSTKVVPTGPNTFDIPGTFTIRGVSKPETLTLTASREGTGSGMIKGTMAFDRKDYGMNSGIPFIRIADRVEVDVDLQVKRTGGPPLVFKKE